MAINDQIVQENLSGEAEFDMEVPKEIKPKVTPCYSQLDCCFEIDSNAVREVRKEVEKLGICLKHLNLDQNKFHRPVEGESYIKATQPFYNDRKKHEEDSTSFLRLIARWINNVASSNNNLLNLLINKAIGDFNTTETKATLPSSSTVIGSSDNLLIPSFFHLNIDLAVKNINMNEDEENSQLDSKIMVKFDLANMVRNEHISSIVPASRTSLQYKLPHPVETPIDDSEQILPEPIFSDWFANEWIEKYEDIFSVLYEENNKDFGMEKINESIRKYIKPGCNLPTPNLVFLQGGPEANSNDNVYESCDMILSILQFWTTISIG
ncbi:16152_t:CDS:2 [Entrophospora sp. SA101]|nr:16152_t:CDS:2 [Entrophospora sp. SA101]